MRLSATKLTSIAAAVGAGALGLSMIGNGVGANFVRTVTGQASINVGTFDCQLSSTNGNVGFNDDSHSATVTLPTIDSSNPGSETVPLTVTNTGSIPLAVTWTVTTSGTVFDSGAVTYAPVAQGVQLNAGKAHTYRIGFDWNSLNDADLGTSGTATYTATCGEANSDISFFDQDGGTAGWNSDGTAAVLSLPSSPASDANAGLQLNNPPTGLPTDEPTFTTDNYGAGSPRWYIELSNGAYLFGYPSNSGLTADWQENGPGASSSGYVSWSTVLADYGSTSPATTVTGVSILMDTDQPGTTDTISKVVYDGTTYIG